MTAVRLALISAFVALVALQPLRAEESRQAERLAAAREYAELVFHDQMVRPVAQMTARTATDPLRQASGAAPAAIDALSDRMADILERQMAQDLIEPMIAATADHFALEELQAIVAFYRTPIGQSVNAKTGDYELATTDAILLPYLQRQAPAALQGAIMELRAEGAI